MKNKPPTEDQIEAEIKAQARMVKKMDEIDRATPEELDAMIENIPVFDPKKKSRLEAAGFHVTDDPRDLLEPLEVIRELRARVAELERSLKIQCDHAAELEKETAAWSRESIRLSPEDQAVFAEALLNPPPMAEPLKRAFERLASLTK